MNIKHRLRAFVFVSSLGVFGAAAGSAANAASNAPIEIQACTPVYESGGTSPYAVGLQRQTGIEVRFVNHADVAAREVAVRVGDAASTAVMVERGIFTPGVAVRATFDSGSQAAETCRVVTARFADGATFAAAPRTAVR